jgi:tetratricopeptide (TPR) repeat protein
MGLLTLSLTACATSSPSPHPTSASEWAKRGRALLQPEHAAEARRAYTCALVENPDDLPSLLGRAQAAVWDEAPQAALSDLTYAISRRPLAQAYWLRASIRVSQSDFTRAASDMRQAILLAPREACLYSAYGQVLLRQNKPQLALRAVNLATELEPFEPSLRLLRGAVLLKLRRYSESSAELTRALEARATRRSYELRGDAFFAQGEHQAAVIDYTEVLRRQPASLCRVARGLCFLELDRMSAAERDFSAWLKSHPTDARVHLWRGITRASRHAFGLAEADFDRALALVPSAPLQAQIEEQRALVSKARQRVW